MSTTKLLLNDADTELFLDLKAQYGCSTHTHMAALRTFLGILARGGIAKAAGVAPPTPEAPATVQDPSEADWAAFRDLVNALPPLPDYWDERKFMVSIAGRPANFNISTGVETPKQTELRCAAAARFVADWNSWTLGDFTDTGLHQTYAQWRTGDTPPCSFCGRIEEKMERAIESSAEMGLPPDDWVLKALKLAKEGDEVALRTAFPTLV